MKFRALIAALVVTMTIAVAPGAVAADYGAEDDDCGDMHIPEDRDCDGEIDDAFQGETPDSGDDRSFWAWIADFFGSIF